MNGATFLGLHQVAQNEINTNYERKCSSLLYRNGIYYSYGSHYPLIFSINGQKFINVKGYSASTAKHINRAWSNYNGAIAIEWNGGAYTADNALVCLYAMKREKEKEISKCVRAVSQKKTQLEKELQQIDTDIERVCFHVSVMHA